MAIGKVPFTVTIPSGESASNSFLIKEGNAFMVRIPASLQGFLAIEIADAQGNFSLLRDSGRDGTNAHEFTGLAAPAGGWPTTPYWYAFPFEVFAASRVRFRTITSATNSTNVLQAAARVFHVAIKG